MTKTIDLSKLSAADLEAALAEKKAAEKKELEQRKLTYEKERNELVIEVVTKALDVHEILNTFKEVSFKHMNNWFERMREYGSAKEDQENFQLVSADGNLKVLFNRNVTKGFDERSKLAEAKLKEFLNGFVKKRDKVLFELIQGILERNAVTGDLDISNINRLYAMEDKFEDENWKEAIKLFKESYVERSTKYYARFFKKADTNDAWVAIKLDYAAL